MRPRAPGGRAHARRGARRSARLGRERRDPYHHGDKRRGVDGKARVPVRPRRAIRLPPPDRRASRRCTTPRRFRSRSLPARPGPSRHDPLKQGAGQSPGHADHERERVDLEQARGLGPGAEREEGGGNRLRRVQHHREPAPVETVPERASVGREEDGRASGEGGEEPDGDRAVGQLDDEPASSDGLHPERRPTPLVLRRRAGTVRIPADREAASCCTPSMMGSARRSSVR